MAVHEAKFNTMIRYYLLLLMGPRRGRYWVLCPKAEEAMFPWGQDRKRGLFVLEAHRGEVVESREVTILTRKEGSSLENENIFFRGCKVVMRHSFPQPQGE